MKKSNIKELSINGHTKNVVVNQLIKSFTSRDYKLACYYSVQMHCSNWLIDWWQTVLVYAAKNCNVNNPKIGKFLLTIQKDFPDLLKSRANTTEIREAIALVAGVLTFTPKDVQFYNLKAMEEIECQKIISHIDYININYIVEKESLPTDSKLIMKILSKFVESIVQLNLQESLRILGACLYLEKNKKYKASIQCGRRNWNELNENQKRDWIFLLWDVLLNLSSKNSDLYEVVSCWRLFYVQNYLFQKRNALWSYVVHCIILLTNPLNFSLMCVHNEEVINKGCSVIDSLYIDALKSRRKVQVMKCQ